MAIVSNNTFKDIVLKVIGEKEVSNTQKYRVLLIRDSSDDSLKVSFQKWWRQSASADWQVGKGFKLNAQECQILGTFLLEGEADLKSIS